MNRTMHRCLGGLSMCLFILAGCDLKSAPGETTVEQSPTTGSATGESPQGADLLRSPVVGAFRPFPWRRIRRDAGPQSDVRATPADVGARQDVAPDVDNPADAGQGADTATKQPDAGTADLTTAPPDASAKRDDALGSPDVPGVEAARTVGNAQSAMGYNLDFPGDWSELDPFIDLMKGARGWNGGCADATDPNGTKHLNLDANGWPRSLTYLDDPSRAYCNIATYISSRKSNPEAGKTYVVSWEGTGEVEVFNAGNVVADYPNHIVTFVLQNDNSALRIIKTDPNGTGDYVRNIKIVRQDRLAMAASGEVFNPDMLAYLAPFGSIRFMDWMLSNNPGTCSGGSNDSQTCYPESGPACPSGTCVVPGKWSERPTPDQASWGSWSQFLDNRNPALGAKQGGYPIEVMVALANRLGADPHFNIPAAYDDDYVTRFGDYLRDHLAPNLRASIEYSNEVWNWGFPQASYANAMGQKLWPNLGEAWVEFMAARTQNMCRILKTEFAGQTQRLRCLISPQTGWQGLGQTVLDCPDWVKLHPELGTSCDQDADAIAITGYYSGCLQDNESAVLGWIAAQGQAAAVATGIEQLRQGSANLKDSSGSACADTLANTIAGYGFWKGLAKSHNLDIYVYEGSMGVTYGGSNATMRQYLVDLAHSPAMYDLYLANYAGYKAAGGTIFNVWGWIGRDSWWSVSDTLFDLSHPKYRATVDFAVKNPCWWAGCDRSSR